MPIFQLWHFVCPITGTEVSTPDNTLPDRWARIADEVYSPQGMGVLAHRILKHPNATYQDLLTAQFPSTTYDDWVS